MVLRLADICLRDGDIELGINALMRAQDAHPDLEVKVQMLERACMICQAHQKNSFGLVPSQRWVELQADSPRANYYYGLFSLGTRHIQNAIQCFGKAVQNDPQNPWYDMHLGQALSHDRQPLPALKHFDKAIERLSDETTPSTSMLYALNWLEGLSEQDIFNRHKAFGERVERKCVTQKRGFRRARNNSRIRIAYLSGDYYHHSVSYFFLPLIKGVDRERFEVFCYSDGRYKDEMTDLVKSHAEHWYDVVELDCERLVDRINSDCIDILVDLSTYAGNFRMDVFARQAAPVQVCYLGYPNTSGLSRMSYRITDEWADPPGLTDAWHTEKLVRLPSGFLCYSPYFDVPVSPLPALDSQSGGICFGSFNSFQKITAEVLETWLEILRKIDHSVLLVKAIALQDDETKAKLQSFFTDKGIEAHRLKLYSWTHDKEEHLALYSRVDIHLDTFPYNGTTTTCEALWQGVPTITIAGEAHRSRVGVSLLKQVGLTDYIAENREAYIDLAVEKSQDLECLAKLRSDLREQMAGSKLMDVAGYSEELSSAYEQMLHEAWLD